MRNRYKSEKVLWVCFLSRYKRVRLLYTIFGEHLLQDCLCAQRRVQYAAKARAMPSGPVKNRKRCFEEKTLKRTPENNLQQINWERTEEEKNRQMPGRSRSQGHAKDGPDPTSNPRSFSLVWSHIWAKFPLLTWAKRKSSGWVDGGSGPLLPPGLNGINTVDPWVTKAAVEQYPDPDSVLIMVDPWRLPVCEQRVRTWTGLMFPVRLSDNFKWGSHNSCHNTSQRSGFYYWKHCKEEAYYTQQPLIK